ncbi:MAG TPA: hypothetical protein PLV92_18010, partial [Pirellulaceae bacterium]|nr:hypothetical protein [Pirellulaceae bacterium]
DAAGGGYVEFDVKDEQPVEIDFMPQDGGGVVFNGLEVDRPDPRRRALQPSPADDDEHAVESPVLRWAAATGAVSHHVYVGTSYDAVARATQRSPEFRGATNSAEFKTESLGLTHREPAYWRIDEVFSDGAGERNGNGGSAGGSEHGGRAGGGNRIERGEVWRFQIRRLAFSQAEGYGRFASGGRAGRVIEVVNLDDAGPGSLRAAVEAAGPRTVVFRVGGLIALQSKLIVRNPYLTIAGQTAPGDGICVKNFTFGCSDTHDVIIRHMRIRVGDESKLTQDGSGARGSDHVIYDHCSISWSIDEGFSSREARNLTVQRCLIAEALHLADHKKYMGTGKGHSFAGSISGNIGSFHHNLLAHCTGRNWSLAGGLDRTGQRLAGRLDIRNNVVFNWRDRTTDGGVRELCFVDNLYLPGPATTVHSLLKPDRGDADRGMRAFMAGNRIEGRARESDDNWSAFVGTGDDRRKIQVDAPLWPSHVTTQPTDELLENVLRDVGATRPARDAVDRRIIDDVRRRGTTFSGSKGKLPGIIDSQADAGGWPEYRSGDPPRDTDHDGLPDDWEVRQGLNPRSPADASRYAPGGFTYLELYLDELASGEEMNRR